MSKALLQAVTFLFTGFCVWLIALIFASWVLPEPLNIAVVAAMFLGGFGVCLPTWDILNRILRADYPELEDKEE